MFKLSELIFDILHIYRVIRYWCNVNTHINEGKVIISYRKKNKWKIKFFFSHFETLRLTFRVESFVIPLITDHPLYIHISEASELSSLLLYRTLD